METRIPFYVKYKLYNDYAVKENKHFKKDKNYLASDEFQINLRNALIVLQWEL